MKKSNTILKSIEGKGFLEAVFNSIEDGILILDKDLNILEINKFLIEQLGMERDEVIGQKCYEVIPKMGKSCDFTQSICPVKEAQATGRSASHLHVYLDKEKRTRYVLTKAIPLKGLPIEATAEIIKDVTELAACETALEESEKKFRSIFETATDTILILNKKGNIVLANKALERTFGYNIGEIIGKEVSLLLSEGKEKFYQALQRIRGNEGLQLALELKAMDKHTEAFPIRLAISSFRLRDDIYFTTIITDLTEAKAYEFRVIQAERLAAIGEAAAFLTHEVKNPLVIIGGFARQLLWQESNEQQREKLKIIIEEVGRLEKLLKDVGDFVRPMALEKGFVNINELLDTILTLFKEEIERQGIIISKKFDDQLPLLKLDPHRIKQVFFNIIKNSIEAMPNGGELGLRTSTLAGNVQIVIKDTGSGIEPSILKQIFYPFFTTKKEGTGLGLAICHKIIQQHAGSIRIESEVGKGTVCYITFPIID